LGEELLDELQQRLQCRFEFGVNHKDLTSSGSSPPNAKVSSGGLLTLSCVDATDKAAVCCNLRLGGVSTCGLPMGTLFHGEWGAPTRADPRRSGKRRQVRPRRTGCQGDGGKLAHMVQRAAPVGSSHAATAHPLFN
jgi:hypothetical protein